MADTITIPINRKPYRSIVISAAFAVFMVRLNNYIVNISLPAISRDFHVAISEVSWVVLSYLLVMTSSMLIFGKLGDRIGLKKIFIVGYVCFTVSSLFCGLSPNITSLYISRGIQGIGGAMMMASAFAIIAHFLPESISGWAFGLCSFANSLGVMVGAPLGGVITGYFSWIWVFLINIPVGLIGILIAWKALPDDKPIIQEYAPHAVRHIHTFRAGKRLYIAEDSLNKETKTPFDITGSILSFIGLSAFVYAFSMGNDMGWESPIILSALIVAVIAFGAFIYYEKRSSDPILVFNLFKNRDFTFAILTTLVAIMLLSGGNLLLPFYLELAKGLPTEKVGFVLLVYSLVYMPIAPLSGRLSDKINPRLICSVAMFLGLVACLFFASTLALPGLKPAVIYLMILAVAYSLFYPANNHLVMSLAPYKNHGVASGMYSTAINISLVLGICLFESVFSYARSEGISLNHTLPEWAGMTSDPLTNAFQFAFIVGSIVCLLAFVLSLLTGKKGINHTG
jgi:MFS family permease